jgi:hypothetical protein
LTDPVAIVRPSRVSVIAYTACTEAGSRTVVVKTTGEEQLTVDGLKEIPPEPPDLTTSTTATIATIAMPTITSWGGMARPGGATRVAPADVGDPG